MSKYPHELVLKFQTETDRHHFIYFWLSQGGEQFAGMTTVCDPEHPSWLKEDPPSLRITSFVDDELSYARIDG